MSELIFKAIITGFVLSIMIGPVFFVLLDTSIRKGIRAALFFDFGVLVSDLIYILAAYFSYAYISRFSEGDNQAWLKMFGGTMFLVFGTITYFKTPKEVNVEDLGKQSLSRGYYAMLFMKGLLLNMLNPMVVFYWFSVMTLGVKQDSELSFASQMIVYIGVLLLVFFSIDVLKIIGAKKLRPYITNAVLKRLNHITGAILALFGIVLLAQGIIDQM